MSRTSVIPDLIDALIANAKARPGLSTVIVTDAVDLAQTNDFRFMVGASDPMSVSPQPSASADQDWAGATPQARDESGSITCAVSGASGDTDPKAIRDEIFRIAGEIQTMLRVDILQSVPGLRWTGYTGQTFEQWRNTTTGVEALLTFRIEFKARL
jgi:hypothetical protein